MDILGKAKKTLDRGVMLAVGLAVSAAPLAWGSAVLGRIAAGHVGAEPENLKLTAAVIGARANRPVSGAEGPEIIGRHSVGATTSVHVLHRWTAEAVSDQTRTRPDTLADTNGLPSTSASAPPHATTPLASVPPTGPIRDAR